jgi:arsenite-transporting ATPase
MFSVGTSVLPLENRKIFFVGGKGGVGKTTTAAALAVSLAARSERCLLVSTDPAHSLGDLFGVRIGDREHLLQPNLWGLEIDPGAQVDRHLEAVRSAMREFVRPEMYHEIERQMELTRLSPGAVEAAMVERVAELMIEAGDRFDRVLVDTAPTGHTLRLLSLPEIMTAWTDGLLRQRERTDATGEALKRLRRRGAGDDLAFVDHPADEEADSRSARIRETLLARRRKFTQARRLLLDATICGFILVLVPERLPVEESRKALEVLRRFDVPVIGVVVNRVLPPEPLGAFLEQRREQEARYLAQIDQIFEGVPQVRVPLLPHDVDGVEGLHDIVRALFAS